MEARYNKSGILYPSTFDEMKIVNEMMNDKWIGIEEAAEYLGIKPITVRDWIKKIQEFLLTKLARSGNSSFPN